MPNLSQFIKAIEVVKTLKTKLYTLYTKQAQINITDPSDCDIFM